MTTDRSDSTSAGASRRPRRHQTAPNGFGGGIPAGTPERPSTGRTELRTVTPAPCGHPDARPDYCPSCRRERHDAIYAMRHRGHHIVETAATRSDGRHYRQCLTCAPWRTPLLPGPPPLDEIAIARAVAGEPPERMRPVERRAAILQLRPKPVPLIAELVGCSERTVWRALAAARDQAA